MLLSAAFSMTAEAADTATDPWEMRVMAQTVYAGFKDSDLRDSLFGAGFFFGGDYLERSGFTVGYNYTEIQGKGSGPGTFDTLEENTVYLSGNLSSYPDSLGGRLNWRLDTYFVKNDLNGTSPGATDDAISGDIVVINPIISFMGNDERFGFDIGYAYSNYDYDGIAEYQAHQITPTIGFAVGGPANWVQLRGFFIQLSDEDVNSGKKDTAAVEAKWTHWFAPDAPLRLRSVGLNLMGGKRFLGVDPDAAVVYTIADEQQGSVAVHASWNLGAQTSLMLQGGFEKFEDRALQNDYDSSYVYLNLSHEW